MFTGLIEAICIIRAVSNRGISGGSLIVDLGALAEGCKVGDSISISGVCLTVSRLDRTVASFELSSETLTKSNLGRLKTGSQVNVERAMPANGRFGGHIVQGHADGTVTIKNITRQGQFADIEFAAPAQLLENMVVKGSVAVDGISLTVAGLGTDGFSVAVIPETLNRTTLGKARIGDCVNVETDIIIKAVKKQLGDMLPGQRPLTVERLKELGF